MARSYTLKQNPNPYKKQYRFPRRESPSGVVVVHSAENTPNVSPPDSGAEGVASYISRRRNAGSYHVVVDSDSLVYVLPPDHEAWQDGTGSNRHAYAISGAFRAAGWKDLPEWWRKATIKNMAKAARDYADWLKANHGVVIPARRISRAESDNRKPGFISHAERDPARRSDPGDDFPWDEFLAEFEGSGSPEEEEDDGMLALIISIYEAHELDWVKDPAGVAFWERHGKSVGTEKLHKDMLGAIHADSR